jgi:hypothetical protein
MNTIDPLQNAVGCSFFTRCKRSYRLVSNPAEYVGSPGQLLRLRMFAVFLSPPRKLRNTNLKYVTNACFHDFSNFSFKITLTFVDTGRIYEVKQKGRWKRTWPSSRSIISPEELRNMRGNMAPRPESKPCTHRHKSVPFLAPLLPSAFPALHKAKLTTTPEGSEQSVPRSGYRKASTQWLRCWANPRSGAHVGPCPCRDSNSAILLSYSNPVTHA